MTKAEGNTKHAQVLSNTPEMVLAFMAEILGSLRRGLSHFLARRLLAVEQAQRIPDKSHSAVRAKAIQIA